MFYEQPPPPHFNAGNRQKVFVSRFVYLGITLDTEMTLKPQYKNVCMLVEQNLLIGRQGGRLEH